MIATEDTIENPESRFQVCISLVILRSHDLILVRDGIERSLIGYNIDTLALDGEVEEGLGARVCLVLELGENHKMSRRTIEAFEYRVVESFQWGGSDVRMPIDLGNELHDGHDDVRVRRLLEHPGDTLRVQHVTTRISLVTK